MAIKTKEEMFGDGAGFGTQVPISFTNPSGYGSGNRGIGFGEQLTSAIANRTHYALVLNDEDLNDRVVPFETSGLDAAYQLGSVATRGGGRVVNTDAGPVEARNDLTALFADDLANAMFRASTANDTIPGSVGYDFVGGHLDPEEDGTGTEWAGYMDRRQLGFTGGPTEITAAESVTLNPGGALGTTIRLTTGGQKVYTIEAGPTPPAGNYSELLTGYDLVEISGSGGDDGLYLTDGLGTLETDVEVVNLDGTGVSLNADVSATATFYRMRFATLGPAATVTRLDGVAVGQPLQITAGNASNPGIAVAVHTPDGQGGLGGFAPMFIDGYGRITYQASNNNLPTYQSDTVDRTIYQGGAFFTKATRSGVAGASQFTHMVQGNSDDLAGRMDFTSMDIGVIAGTGIDGSIAFAYTANTTTNGELDLTTASMAGAWRDWLMSQYMLVEILTPLSDSAFYWVRSTDDTPDRLFIRNLDGSVPSQLPTSGTGTLRVFFTSFVGKRPNCDVTDIDGLAFNHTPYNVMQAGEEDDATALTVVTPPTTVGADRAALRVFTMKTLTGANAFEVFKIIPNGSCVTAGEYAYEASRARTVIQPIQRAQPRIDSGGLALWQYSASGSPQWSCRASITASDILDIPLHLPNGAVVTSIEVLLKPASARSASSRFSLSLHRWSMDWTPAIGAPTADTITLSGAVTFVEDDGTTDYQIVTLTPNTTLTVNDVTEDSYYVGVSPPTSPAAGSGDIVYGCRVNFTDPGPRNF